MAYRNSRDTGDGQRRELMPGHDDIGWLQQFSALLIADDPSSELYDMILDAGMAIARADLASIQLFDAERGRLELVASRNFHPESAAFWKYVSDTTPTACGSALRAGERMIVADVAADPRFAGTQSLDHFRLSGIAAVQSTPLRARDGRLLGMLSTHWRSPHHADEHELRLLDILARQVADYFDRCRSQREIRTAQRRMSAQKEAFQSAVNGEPLARSLSLLARLSAEETGGQARTAFYLADRENERLHPVDDASTMPAGYLRDVDAFPIGRTSPACGLAAAAGRPVLTADVTTDPLWAPWLQLAVAYDFRACWSFPIQIPGARPMGTFACYFRDPREPTTSDLALGDLIAQAAAIIIAHHNETEKRERAEAALHEEQLAALEKVEQLVRQRTTERDEARRQLAGVEEEERRRLARELHDQLGQELTALRLELAHTARIINGAYNGHDGQESLEDRVARLQTLAERMIRGTRAIALELRPPELDDVGLGSALETYVREWGARYEIAIELTTTGLDSVDSLPSGIASALYRIVQEALNNVAKHSRARQVSVVISRRGPELRLLVEDDGEGFDVEETMARAQRDRRLGVSGMRERAVLVGGNLEIESTTGFRGTAIYVRVPLPFSTA